MVINLIINVLGYRWNCAKGMNLIFPVLKTLIFKVPYKYFQVLKFSIRKKSWYGFIHAVTYKMPRGFWVIIILSWNKTGNKIRCYCWNTQAISPTNTSKSPKLIATKWNTKFGASKEWNTGQYSFGGLIFK